MHNNCRNLFPAIKFNKIKTKIKTKKKAIMITQMKIKMKAQLKIKIKIKTKIKIPPLLIMPSITTLIIAIEQ